MTQDEINQSEWENQDNWTKGSNLFCVYFSHRDTRTWVPKKIPRTGSTLNLGKAAGVKWLVGFLAGIPAFIILLMILVTVLLSAEI